MENHKVKTYVVDGKKVRFNNSTFADLCKKYADKEKKGIMAYDLILAEKISVSEETIRAWRKRKNGPADIETIKQIANFWRINYKSLIMEVEDMVLNTKFDDRTRTIVVECYKRMEDFFYDFHWECGRFKGLGNFEQIIGSGLFYEGLMKEENCEFGILDVEGETNEERIRLIKNELRKHKLDYKFKVDDMKRMLRQNVLELPRYVYEKWDEFLTTAYEIIDYYHIPEDKIELEDCLEDDIENEENRNNLYNTFFEFCKENIEPCVH
jgi:hypothetical protein